MHIQTQNQRNYTQEINLEQGRNIPYEVELSPNIKNCSTKPLVLVKMTEGAMLGFWWISALGVAAVVLGSVHGGRGCWEGGVRLLDG